MGYNVSAYIEVKNKDTNEWELKTQSPICSYLKYVFPNYNEFNRLNAKDVSSELAKKFTNEETGEAYVTFYTDTIEGMERKVNFEVHELFTKVNTILQALGVEQMYDNDGNELDWGLDEDKNNDKLTFPVNKELFIDLQFALEKLRNIGQREAIDLVASEHISYDDEARIVFVVG